jgi:hypothetical protein
LNIARGKRVLQLGSALHYGLGPRLGEGSFGSVYQAASQFQEVLVKRLKVSTFGLGSSREVAL